MKPKSVLPLIAIILASCSSTGDNNGEVLARVGDEVLTSRDIAAELKRMPGYNRAQYEGKDGERKLLDKLIEQEVMYLAAKEAGYQNDPEVKREIEFLARRALIQAYYQNEIQGGTEITDDDIEEYYKNNQDQFYRDEQVRARHILVSSKEKAERIRARILAGEPFAEVAREVSEDEATREAGGLLGTIRRGAPVKSIGKDDDFVEKVMALKAGELSDVLKTKKGYHIVKVEEHIQEGVRPLEEVKGQIREKLRPKKTRERYNEIIESLKEKYGVTVNEEAFEPEETAESIFKKAQEATNPMTRISYYEKLLKLYPQSEHAAQAQFMIGFIYSEELDSPESAKRAFQKVIDLYPESELVESARWMIENMGKEMPDIVEGLESSASGE